MGNGIKDLTILWDVFKLLEFNKYNGIIVDDNPDVKKTGFCIPMPEFNFFDEKSEDDKCLELTNENQVYNELEKYRKLPFDVQYKFLVS